jgi:beta-phosphoglucomutase-like phosphatase (HAD superfamily)
VEASKCVVIEDAEHGVTAAKKAGMKSIGFQNHHSGTQNLSHSDIVIDDLEQITIELLKSL